MKYIFIKFRFLCLLVSFTFSVQPLIGQNYTCSIENITTTSSSTLEFDIMIAGDSNLKLQVFQAGIEFNYTELANGGTITSSWVPGTATELLPVGNQDLSIETGSNMGPLLVGSGYRQIRITAKTGIGVGAAINLSNTPARYVRMRLSNTVPFAPCASPNFIWSFTNASGRTRTAVAAYINNLATGTFVTTQLTGGTPHYLSTSTAYNYIPGPQYFVANNQLVLGSLALNVSSVTYNETCLNSGDGSIDVAINPTGNYTYLWSNGSTFEDASNLNSGVYTLAISDVNGNCYLHTDTIEFIGANCGSISGKIIYDEDSSCTWSPGDFIGANKLLQLSNGSMAITNFNGDFMFNNVGYGTYNQTILSPLLTSFNSCSQPNNVTLSSTLSNVYNEFKCLPISTYIDNQIGLSSSPMVPGFIGNYQILLQSLSYTPTTTVSYILIDPAISYVSSNVTPMGVYSTANGDSVVFNTTLNPNQFQNILIQCQVPVNLALFYPLNTSCALTVTNGLDSNVSNNQDSDIRVVTGSFDPNDKHVNPIGNGPTGIITLSDTVLDYTINFQNCGTGPAHNIVIMDTLSPYVDITTLQILGFSHPYQIEIINNNILKFKFPNIMLPDSNVDEPGSHGYVSYKIEQKNTNVIGDIIYNTASIYFDFNSPVVTNTTINTIGNLTPTHLFPNQPITPSIHPNPATNYILLYHAHLATRFKLFNVLGQEVFSTEIENNIPKQRLNVPTAIPNGIYFYQIVQKDAMLGGKLEIKR